MSFLGGKTEKSDFDRSYGGIFGGGFEKSGFESPISHSKKSPYDRTNPAIRPTPLPMRA